MGYTTIFEGYLTSDLPLPNKLSQEINDINPYNNYYRKTNNENYGMDDYLHNDIYKKKIGSNIDSYCQWCYNEKEKVIEWDGGEKFYGYILWLKFILKLINEKSNCKFNGIIRWMGEEIADIGLIEVIDNEIKETSYIVEQLKKETWLLN